MKKLALFSLTVVSLLALAGTAFAVSLPKTKTNLVDVPTSIGGVKVNQSVAKATAAWGKDRGKCELTKNSGNCNYGDFSGPGGSATISFFENKVVGMSVTTGQSAKGGYKASAAGALMKLKTSSGIGLGSPAPKVKKAYPKAEQIGDKSDGFYTFVIKGKGKGSFSFSIYGETNKVYMMSANNGQGG